MEEKFGNYCTIIGDVAKEGKKKKEINGEEAKLGNLKLNLNNGQNGFTNIWNLKNVDRNKVLEFYDQIEEGERIQIQGSLEEDYYQNEYRRRLNAQVYRRTGVNFNKTNKEPKFVAMLRGNIIDRELRYEDIERFDGDNIAKMEIKLAIYNFYNRETKKEDLTKNEVLINELNKEKNDLEDNNNEDAKAYKTIKKLIKKAEENDGIENHTKVLNKFYELFNPRMYNIDILNLVAYKDMAEELRNQTDKYDNAKLAVQVNNYQEKDEFEVTIGFVNEVEIKKIYEVNKRKESNSDDNEFLDGDW